MNASTIKSMRFRDTISCGPSAIPTTSVAQGEVAQGQRLLIDSHPTDPRFMLLTYTDINHESRKFYQLVAVDAVTTVILTEAPTKAAAKVFAKDADKR